MAHESKYIQTGLARTSFMYVQGEQPDYLCLCTLFDLMNHISHSELGNIFKMFTN